MYKGQTTQQRIDKFWSNINKSDESGCWEWVAAKITAGYGTIQFEGKTQYAHRLMYRFTKGEIPKGMVIDHSCRNRSCVNPEHLRAVTTMQNCENFEAHKDSRSGIRGVCWAKRENKWSAEVMQDGIRYRLGNFRDIADAESAVIKKRLELFTFNEMDR
jgi:hypothetical protein